MLELIYTKTFEKDLKIAVRRGKDLEKLKKIIELLVTKTSLPAKNKDHKLIGNYINRRECHIEPDWLLIYKIDEDSSFLSAPALIPIYFNNFILPF